MAVENLTTITGNALSIDFTEQFGQRYKTLFDLVGSYRQEAVAEGTLIKTYKGKVTLNNAVVEPGALIPLSKVELEAGPSHELVWDKKRKAVAAEDVQKHGFERAILMSDAKFLNEIQKGIRSKLIAQLGTGTGEATGEGLQAALAQAWAEVTAVFEEDDVEVITFINPFDAADYLAKANISTQTHFGMNYIEDFLNNRIVFMNAAIPKGTFYSTASDNIVFAHAKMDGGEIGKAFDFDTDSTGLIGVTHDINKQHLTAETITMYGVVIYAERLDGVIVGTITEPTP